jgi:transcriptional regulator with XRE-family HTH domain
MGDKAAPTCGGRLRALREAACLSQEELAERALVSTDARGCSAATASRDQRSPLSETERVRLQPYPTERILCRLPPRPG